MERPADLTEDGAGNHSAPTPPIAQANNSGAARGITRRHAGLLLASLAASSFAGWAILQAGPFSGRPAFGSIRSITPEAGRALFDEASASVLPTTGVRSRIALQDSVLKLVAEGVIDAERFASVYESRGGLPVELRYILIWPSHLPIHLTAENAGYYVNLLWPVGLANYMSTNKTSPVNGGSLFNFASTAGWTLGKEENGGAYSPSAAGRRRQLRRVAGPTPRPTSVVHASTAHSSPPVPLHDSGVRERRRGVRHLLLVAPLGLEVVEALHFLCAGPCICCGAFSIILVPNR